MDKIIDICKKYNITPVNGNMIGCATGIGDILFRLLCIKNKLISEPFYINLEWFTKPYYKMEPINQFDFRIKLIIDIIKYNNIPSEMVRFVISNNSSINHWLPYECIENYNLKFDDTNENINLDEYIIFHTKCRHTRDENYSVFKQIIARFCSNNTSKYKIIIMGERIFPHTEEVDVHGITTVYNELIELKNHNDIIDNSIENIYSNLDYDNYKKDIKLIQNAKYNICFGLGGQLCTSTIFGKSTIVYCKVNQTLNTHNFKKNNFFCNNLNDFFTLIKEKCFLH
jgi:hypothetical protein